MVPTGLLAKGPSTDGFCRETITSLERLLLRNVSVRSIPRNTSVPALTTTVLYELLTIIFTRFN